MICFGEIVEVYPSTPPCARKVGWIAVDYLVPSILPRSQVVECVGLYVFGEGRAFAHPTLDNARIAIHRNIDFCWAFVTKNSPCAEKSFDIDGVWR